MARDLAPAGSGAVDVDAIEARALAAPVGPWEAFPDMVRIPFITPDDDTPDGRYLVFMRGDWHRPEDVPDGVWEFIGTARDDVLALVALARWLSGALASALAVGERAGASR